MSRYGDIVLDNFSRPIPGASIYVYDNQNESLVELTEDGGGPLANPVTSDSYGNYYFNAPSGIYILEYRLGGARILRREQVVVGTGPELPDEIVAALAIPGRAALIGSDGPSNVQDDIDAFKGPGGSELIGFQRTGGDTESAADYLAEWVYPDAFKTVLDADDRASFERARDYLVALNGRHGGVIRLRNGVTYELPGTVVLAPGIIIQGITGSLPVIWPSTVGPLDVLPVIRNTTSDPTFTWGPPVPNDDRYAGPSLHGVAMVADNAIDFGYDDDVVSFYMSNSWITDCAFIPYSAKGETALRVIENYRGGVRGCWIENFAAAVIYKSGDFGVISSNRIWNCDVPIAVLSPATTGTQTIISHNDILKQTATTAHPDFGGSYAIYTEDRWCSIRDNYFEATLAGPGTVYDAVIKTADSGSSNGFQHLEIRNNRYDLNSDQADYLYDFSDYFPLNLMVENNRSDKGPNFLTAVNWPSKYYYYPGANLPNQRRIVWTDLIDPATPPPMRWREGGSDLTLDAGNVAISSANAGADLYAYDNTIRWDYTAQNSNEHYIWLPYVADQTGAHYWDVEIDYSGTGGVQFIVQPRSDTIYVAGADATLTTTSNIQTHRIKGIQRTGLKLDLVNPNTTTYGTVIIHSVRFRPSIATPATIADPSGGATVDTEARVAINAVLDLLQTQGLMS